MSMDEKMECPCVSRRQMLIGTGVLAASTALMQFGGLLTSAQAKDGSTEKWPWPYEKLDPQKTAEIAYEEWYRVFCGAGVINSVVSQLREKIGEPYKSFPADAFVFLEGGMAGWGTICGSNAGANVISNLIIGPRISAAKPEEAFGPAIGADMMLWYSDTPLPTFVPGTPKQPVEIVKTISKSPLCHVSVGKWMSETGFSIGSPERKDRCARITASVAYRLVEDLNAWKDGKYEAKSKWAPGKEFGIPGQPNCTECHGKDIPTAPKPKAA